MIETDLLKQLNPPQCEAVQNTEGPLLVLAGAGSGKTRVLTYRIAFLIAQGLAYPHQILAVTFTNKAANEMKQRVEKLLELPVQSLWIGTFHAISARILHREAEKLGYSQNFTIYDVDDQINLIKRIMDRLSMNKESISPRQVQYAISHAKNRLQDARQFEKSAKEFRSRQIAKIFLEYETALRRNNAMDFDDLLLKPIDLFTAHPEVRRQYQEKFRYVLVDEYQDTNKAQYYWIKMLADGHKNICVVGDEDQSIYRWRGADINNILNFEKDFENSRIVRLEQNYRSTQTILNAANALVARNLNRLGKNLWSAGSNGDPIHILETSNEMHEARAVADVVEKEKLQNSMNYRDMVVLYRTNAQSRALEEQLRHRGIPYMIVGGTKFYERKEIKDIIAYLRLIVNPDDSVSLLRALNTTPGIGGGTIGKLSDYSRQKEVSLYQAMLEVENNTALLPGYQKRISEFSRMIEKLRESSGQLNVYDFVIELIKTAGLKRAYESSELIEDKTRLENINEFINSLDIFVKNNPQANDLQAFLDEVSLLTDIDKWDPEQDYLTLMTLHSAKGLEFPVVMITGLEDGLFPLSRSIEDPEELEEERRLFYVGMTRSRMKLYLLYAMNRHRFQSYEYGSSLRSLPSRFLKEIPAELVHRKKSGGSSGHQRKFSFADAARKRSANTAANKALQNDSGYQIGQYVRHQQFGSGQILGVENSRMGTKVTIVFEGRQIRKLIAEYAQLTITENAE
ncbi:MAG: UvrD-helicase domain-containing protein [Calditrichia bacterium]